MTHSKDIDSNKFIKVIIKQLYFSPNTLLKKTLNRNFTKYIAQNARFISK